MIQADAGHLSQCSQRDTAVQILFYVFTNPVHTRLRQTALVPFELRREHCKPLHKVCAQSVAERFAVQRSGWQSYHEIGLHRRHQQLDVAIGNRKFDRKFQISTSGRGCTLLQQQWIDFQY